MRCAVITCRISMRRCWPFATSLVLNWRILLNAIKLATQEQIERIKDTADFVPTSQVLAMGEDLAVVKQVVEVDPVYFNEQSSTQRRLLFVWGIENWLRLVGTPVYYFNTSASDEAAPWRKVA